MLSLSLAKLSTAQDADSETSKLNWSHNTQDLFMVIDTFGARGPISQLLKVVQSTQVLVRTMQDISYYHPICKKVISWNLH